MNELDAKKIKALTEEARLILEDIKVGITSELPRLQDITDEISRLVALIYA